MFLISEINIMNNEVIMTEEENLNYSMKNPWDVVNLDDFLYYCCPECDEYRDQSRDLFIQHASEVLILF